MSDHGRRPVIAGNWKMNTTLDEATDLASAVAERSKGVRQAEVLVIPPACFLEQVAEAVTGSPVSVGAQNMHPEPGGAYTGEIAGPMLESMGVSHVLCGHSERRQLFGESPEWVGRKVAAAHRHGLTPILCVGETLEERQDDRTEAVVVEQIDRGLAQLTAAQVSHTIVAYEPVWAIGTGHTATPEQAQEVHASIRRRLGDRFGQDVARTVRIQYGGSVKPQNAESLLAQPDIDGALVGGASLKADSFTQIVEAAIRVLG
ncbi:MAG: triose-phosphate isomerase [Myxococcota bacterium]